MDKIEYFWLAATILMFILEAVTVNLVSVWFALGSLAALIAAFFGAQLWLQIAIFFIVTVVTLIATRPLVKKYFSKNHHVPTNVDAVIGRICIVTDDIDNLAASGQVIVDGMTWTARSEKGEKIRKDSQVRVLSVNGVKLIVEPLPEKEL